MNKAVFIDRDGTINQDTGYLNHLDQIRLLPHVPEAIKLIKDVGFRVIVITNQAGIAKGFLTEEFLEEANNKIYSLLKEKEAVIDKFYWCPHHPDAPIERYRLQCQCRKPSPGLVLKAAKDFNIELKDSFVIGDKDSDLEVGFTLGMKSVLVLTGYGQRTLYYLRLNGKRMPHYIASNLYEAARWILTQTKR